MWRLRLLPVLTCATTAVALAAAPLPSGALAAHHLQLQKAEELYGEAWRAINENYFDRAKLAHWQDWQHKFDGRLRNRQELRHAIEEMVSSLQDDYTYVLSGDDLQERSTKQATHHSVLVRRLRGNIGYLQITDFEDSDAAAEFAAGIRRLGDVSGYVLDLRDNHGGFIRNAQSVFAMVTDKGIFTTYSGYQDGDKDSEIFDLQPDGWHVSRNERIAVEPRPGCLCRNQPLVVLVNRDTRSAAEMLAGALRDNGRAIVLGTRTFGKGVLQDTYRLSDGTAIKVVTARYFLPDGSNIHNKGITPDLVVKQADDKADRQLCQASAILRNSVAQAGRLVHKAASASRAAVPSM